MKIENTKKKWEERPQWFKELDRIRYVERSFDQGTTAAYRKEELKELIVPANCKEKKEKLKLDFEFNIIEP